VWASSNFLVINLSVFFYQLKSLGINLLDYRLASVFEKVKSLKKLKSLGTNLLDSRLALVLILG
jgi:hypothetical protein